MIQAIGEIDDLLVREREEMIKRKEEKKRRREKKRKERVRRTDSVCRRTPNRPAKRLSLDRKKSLSNSLWF